MTIKITKYRRIGGGNTITHSPIEISNLSEGQRAGLIEYLNTQRFYTQPIEDVVMVYKANVERGGLFGIRKRQMPTPCEIEELMPHIKAYFPSEEIIVEGPIGYVSS